MFKKGEKLIISVKDNGEVTDYYGCVVLRYEDGLLKVRQADEHEVVYNVHSLYFVKAQKDTD